MSHKKYRNEKNCLNCGALVERKFCPECGQENLQIQENFFHMAAHFIADYFHYDSKFFRNLKLLILKPGFLTKEYLEGKRVRHIHPLRLYFFITIVMVVLANLYYKKYEKEIKGANITITEDDGTERKLKEMGEVSAKEMSPALEQIGRGFDNIAYYLKYISFFLLPVYALVFRILYWKKKKSYVDHLVYTLHVQSFAYLILSLLLLIPLFISQESRDWFAIVLLIIVAVYITISLRYLYRQSWALTVFKSVLAIAFMLAVTLLSSLAFIVVALN